MTSRLKVFAAQNGIIGALVVLVVVVTVLNPRFVTPNNLQSVIEQVAEVGIIAIPLAFLVMSGSIDLSVGSIASVGAVTFAKVSVATGSVAAGATAALAAGLAIGLVNGVLVAYAQLNAFVVTLGALNVWGGVALFVTQGRTVTGLPAGARTLADLGAGPFTLPVITLLVTIVVAWAVLTHAPFGKHVLATGGNPRAAYLMGISTRSVRFVLFLVSGGAAALAGVLLVAKLQAASPSVGSGMEMNALTMVLLGGVAFEGGKGRVSGIVAGLLFVGVLRNGLVLLGVSQFLQTVVTGLTLIVAVSLDKGMQRIVGKAWNTIAKDLAGRDGGRSPDGPHDGPDASPPKAESPTPATALPA